MNERNFLECKFSNDIVPYMYGELPSSKSSIFESHLLDCIECTDEFAAISSARFEVYDWKKVEFDPLPTPRFAIPYESEAVGFAEKIRAAFVRTWVFPGLAFAGLTVLSISAAIVLFSGEDGREIVDEIGNANAPAVNSPVAIERPQAKPIGEINSAPRASTEKSPQVLKASVPVVERNETRRGAHRSRSTVRSVEAKQASVQAEGKSVPRLNGFPEDEDTSLRLAELFEDIETRD
jgi:hypothetical protein